MILNLGSGNKRIAGAVNVDKTPGRGDMVFNLRETTWPWKDNSIDGIYASHIIEHFANQKQFIRKCYRILKPGGFLRITVPHASCISSVGCMGHYRTYSYDTLRTHLEAHSSEQYYFGKPLFKTTYQRLNWWYEKTDLEGNMSPIMVKIIKLADWLITPLINLSPQVFENLWWPLVGGAREVIWEGVKI